MVLVATVSGYKSVPSGCLEEAYRQSLMCVLTLVQGRARIANGRGRKTGEREAWREGENGGAGREEKGRKEQARGKEDESSFTGRAVRTRRPIGPWCSAGPC
jgi:hypothetical protein